MNWAPPVRASRCTMCRSAVSPRSIAGRRGLPGGPGSVSEMIDATGAMSHSATSTPIARPRTRTCTAWTYAPPSGVAKARPACHGSDPRRTCSTASRAAPRGASRRPRPPWRVPVAMRRPPVVQALTACRSSVRRTSRNAARRRARFRAEGCATKARNSGRTPSGPARGTSLSDMDCRRCSSRERSRSPTEPKSRRASAVSSRDVNITASRPITASTRALAAAANRNFCRIENRAGRVPKGNIGGHARPPSGPLKVA